MRASLLGSLFTLLLLGGGVAVFSDMLPDAYLATHEVVPVAITWTVTKTADTNDGVCDADCSLREAVAAAASGDTIVFSSFFNSPQTITLTLGQIAITQNLTITGPGSDLLSISGNNAGRIFYISGGVTVTMTAMMIRDGNVGAGGPGTARGGGILSGSNLNLSNVEMTNNIAYNSMPGVGYGGAIGGYNNAAITLDHVYLHGNTAPNGAGVSAEPALLNISNSTVSNNTGHGISADISANIINTVVSGNTTDGVSSNDLNIVNSTVTGNEIGIIGGSSRNIKVEGSLIAQNTSGGLINLGTATISNTVIRNNTSDYGGGIYNGIVTYVLNSAITGNTAGRDGGGIFTCCGGQLYVTNSTISGNVDGTHLFFFPGGGIYAEQGGLGDHTTITNSTIANNQASGNGGGIRNDAGGTMTIRNTIISGNTSLFASEPDVSGTIVSQGNNLIGNTTGSTGWIAGDLLNVNPMLGPLADNGGNTLTHALLNGSPAINAGNNSLAVHPQTQMPLTGDQRGFQRFVGVVDIGAYEAMSAAPPTIGGIITYGNAIGPPIPRFVSNVFVNGSGSPNVTATSLSDGSYLLSGFGNGAYAVTPSKTGGVNGITSFDAALIAKHVAGFQSLAGNQLIVADVSGNGTITSFDAAEIARYSAGLNNFGATGNWIFMPLNRMYPSVTSNLAGQDFIALLMGEVSGNWMDSGIRPELPQRWLADAWRDENGHVSTNGMENAVAQRDAYMAAHAPPIGFGDDGTAKMNWLAGGPQNVGGRARSLVIDPNNPDTMWAGAVSGGVWKSTNGGASWMAMNGGLQNFAVNCMTLDINPHDDTETLWAGTGEGFSDPGLAGGGLFRSTDGGMTWQVLPNTRLWNYVNSIAVTHKYNMITHQYDTILLAGIEGHRGPDNTGIMRSVDGGETWVQEQAGFSSTSVAFDPNDPMKAVGEIVEFPDPVVYPDGRNQALYSTDWGEHWSTANLQSLPGATPAPFETTNWQQTIHIAYKGSNLNTVYSEKVTDGISVIRISTDGGQSYTQGMMATGK